MAYDSKARMIKKIATIGPTKMIVSTLNKDSGSPVDTGVWEGVVVDGVTPGSCIGRCTCVFLNMFVHKCYK